MTNKVSVIIFTYKRAMLLHNCLETLIKNFKNLDYPIHVIYHYDKKHEESYIKLQNFYKNEKIIFHKRENLNFLKLFFLKMLRPLNFFWIFRWPMMIKEMNSFKYILEEILKNIKNQNVSLCPDDMIYFKHTEIDNEIFNLLGENGDHYQYRYFTSNKFKSRITCLKNLK